MTVLVQCLTIAFLAVVSSLAIANHEAVCGAPPHSLLRNSVLAAIQEAGVAKLLTIDDDFLHAPGSLATYTCINNMKYTMVGCPAISCLANGSWSGPQPKCEPIETKAHSINETATRCSEIVVNKSMMTASFLTKNIVVYHCNNKTDQLTGCPASTCNNGTWTGSPPSCESSTKQEPEVVIKPMPHNRNPIPYNTTSAAFDPLTSSFSSSFALKGQIFVVLLSPLFIFCFLIYN